MDTLKTVLVAAVICLAGCHESLGLVGDAYMDPRPDGTDAATDPADAYEVPADILHDGTEACVPPGDGVWLDWTLDGAEWDDRREIDIPCRILSVAGEDVGHTIIDLECGTGGVIEHHVIEIFSNPHPWLEYLTGAEVTLSYVSAAWEWPDRWFALRYLGGNLIIAGVTASSLAPTAFTVDEWYNPLRVNIATGLCPQEREECGLYERPALDVEYWDDRVLVFDGNSTILGSMLAAQVTVDTLWYYETMECMDFPSTFVSALFVLLPEG